MYFLQTPPVRYNGACCLSAFRPASVRSWLTNCCTTRRLLAYHHTRLTQHDKPYPPQHHVPSHPAPQPLAPSASYPQPDSADDKTDPAGRGRGKEQDEQQGGSFGSLRETGRAPIRSVVDSSKPTPGSGLDEKAAKCANLARSAAYRVMSTVR